MRLLIVFLLTVVIVACQGIEDTVFDRHELVSHRLESPFLEKNLQIPFYDFGGNTFIRNDQYIRLTADSPDQRGWLLSKMPYVPENFQIEFEFKIHGKGNAIYGDGMAFWMLNENIQESGPVLGFKDGVKGSAILFDTYKNNRPGKGFPYVMLMSNDGTQTYDQEHDGLANEITGCSARGLHNPKEISKARITYVKNGFFSLELNYKARNRWELCFEKINFDIGKPVYIGFSAQTGELSEAHDIFKMNIYRLDNPPRSYTEVDYHLNGNKNAQINSSKEEESSSLWTWKGFFTKSFLFILVILTIYIGYTIYRAKNQRSRRKADYLL